MSGQMEEAKRGLYNLVRNWFHGREPMAWLIVRNGEKKGETIPLVTEKTIIIGRDDKCDVAFKALTVSKVHARIWHRHPGFLIEDEDSRNKTYLNGRPITGKGPFTLRKGFVIRICENEFEFQDEGPELESDEDEESSSTIEYTLSESSKQILETQPAEKLALLLDITTGLTQTYDMDRILPKVVETLFKVFKQADRAFLILIDEGSGELRPRIIRTRKEEDVATARFSRQIVRNCTKTGNAFLHTDARELSKETTNDSIYQSRIRSVMCVPLTGRNGRIHGVIQLDTQDPTKRFNQDDLKFLTAVARQAAIALENAAQANLERDLQLAHEIQRGFLPRFLPAMPGYEFAACYEPAQEVGGDYYDFIPLRDQRMAIMVGDVAGKGVSAALLMARLSSATRYALLAEHSPAAFMVKINNLMHEIGIYDKFVTLVAALLDPVSHTVTFVNAGHNLPILYRHATGKLESAFDAAHGGLPIGLVENTAYEECSIQLAPGDIVVMFSDGMIDARNTKETPFTLNGVYKALRKGPFTASALADVLITDVEEHSKGCQQFDDMTVACFGRTT